jgi:hypothetical protein
MKKIVLSSIVALGLISSLSADVVVKSKAGVLKFSGEHRFTFTNSDKKDANNHDKDGSGRFSVDRTYLQVKAYFLENPKSYARVTMDTKEDATGTYDTYLKYSYLYLADIFPNTGVEIGQVHKPWVDYEEHYGFTKQAVYGVYADKLHLTSSADRGVNFKTKLANFSSEIGVFQGEGYKNVPSYSGKGLSVDARLTYHVFGTKNKKNYFNISVAGASNSKHNEINATTDTYGDLTWSLVHAVYKNSQFLVAGQYLNVSKNKTSNTKDEKGTGYSVNGDLYITPKATLFARYDEFKYDTVKVNNAKKEKKKTIGGIAYKYNKNVTFALSSIKLEESGKTDENKVQVLAWIKW